MLLVAGVLGLHCTMFGLLRTSLLESAMDNLAPRPWIPLRSQGSRPARELLVMVGVYSLGV